MRLRLFARAQHLKLKGKINGWIDKLRDGGKGNDKLGGHLIEGQADLKALIIDFQAPELVLEHDGHFVRKALRQMFRYRNPCRPGLERDRKSKRLNSSH